MNAGRALLPAALAMLATCASAEVTLPALISENMALQAEVPVPIWGAAAAGERISVTFAGKRAAAIADPAGHWRAVLPALHAGDAGILRVAGRNTIEVHNVIAGSVWLAAGQSNMGMGMKLVADADKDIATADLPAIRLFDVKGRGAGTPLEDVTGAWVVCSPEALRTHGQWGGFPAVPFLFAREIHQSTGRPVGIIASAYGGTPAEAWTSLDGLRDVPQLKRLVDQRLALPQRLERYRRRVARYQQQLAAWRQETAHDHPQPPEPGASPQDEAHEPAALFNGMIAPLTQAALQGVIWYQGESYSGPAPEYRYLFPALIRSWRHAFARDDLPFLFVQLPNCDANFNWAWTREGQAAALALPHTAMAVAIDAGTPREVHVPNKQVVAHRLALAARRQVLGQPVQASGPVYDGLKLEGAKVRVSFRQVGRGLVCGDLRGPQPGLPERPAGDRARGFELAGGDHQWRPADAAVDGDTLLVGSDRVPAPVAVRYAWADNPEANLYNRDGLPAAPFRSDDWDSEWSVLSEDPPAAPTGPAPAGWTSGVVSLHLACAFNTPDTRVADGTPGAAPDDVPRVWNNVPMPGGNGFLAPSTLAEHLRDSRGGATPVSVTISGRNQSYRCDSPRVSPLLRSYPGAGRYRAVITGLDASGGTTYDLYVYNYWYWGSHGLIAATTTLEEGRAAGDSEQDNWWDPGDERGAAALKEGVNYAVLRGVTPSAAGRIVLLADSGGGALNSLQLVAHAAVRQAVWHDLDVAADAALAGVDAGQARLALSPEHGRDGHRSLATTFSPGDYPHVAFSGPGLAVSDWRPYGVVLFDAYNDGNQSLPLAFRLDDAAGHVWQAGFELPPRELKRVALALRVPDSGMKGYPLAAAVGADIPLFFWQPPFDLGHVTSFQFFLDHPKAEQTVYFSGLRLSEVPALRGIVDRYGQFALADWPGKIHDDAELHSRHAAEDAELATATPPADWDSYGGWASGPKLAASGWFRAERVDGRWWLVTPDGHLFWSTGLDCVRPEIDGQVRGHEDLFAWRPAPDDPLYRLGWAGGWVNFWGMNLYRQDGLGWETAWLKRTGQRLRAWGFNTLGDWSSERACRELRVPFTVPVDYGRTDRIGPLPDPYSERWAAALDAGAAHAAVLWGQDRYCLGYFVDNELPWEEGVNLPAAALALTGERAAKRAMVDLLRTKYGDAAKLTAAWGLPAANWEQLLAAPIKPPEHRSPALQADLRLLLGAIARQYYTQVAQAMKRRAPHQLYLGSRFSGLPPDEVAVAAAEACDVVSYNIYGRAATVLDRGRQAGGLSRPALIGEFHFGALDRGMFHGGMVPVADQAQRGAEYANYVRAAAAAPWCVGAHWFTYADEMLTGRGDGENFNIGFVSVTDTPYRELTTQAAEGNRRLYPLRGRQLTR